MFGKKRKIQVEIKLDPETERLAKLLDDQAKQPPRPTGPIADLCADIVAHPGEYRLDSGTIVHKGDRNLIVHCRGYAEEICDLFEKAWEAVGETQDAEMAKQVRERLAAVKAARPTTIKGPTWTIEAPADRTITAYLCETDWNHELGHARDGNALYPSAADLRDHQPCADQCGIVEVEVRLKRVVSPGKVTIATHTPGVPDAMRDFLTHKPPPKKRKKAGRK